MANTLETYTDAQVMNALLTRDFSGVGYEFTDDVITKLKRFAFARVTGLNKVNLPAVTQIGSCAFYDTVVSTEFTMSWAGITKIGQDAFRDSLGTIKDGTVTLTACTDIGTGAFYGVLNVTSVVAPAWISITQNDSPLETAGIFENSSLQSISAANMVSIVTEATFKGCASLTMVDMPKLRMVTQPECFRNCTGLTSISLPALISAGAYMLSGCTALTSVSLPNMTSMDSYFMYNCTEIENVSFPSLTALNAYAFAQCRKLKTASVPLVTSIPATVFNGCSALTSVTAPLATSLGNSAFSGCTSLTGFTHSEVTTLGNTVFQGCTGITRIEFPKCTQTGNSTFQRCSAMVTCILGGATLTFGTQVFNQCAELVNLVMPNLTAVPTLSSSIFQNCTKMNNGTGKIYVPTALVSAFEAHPVWGNFTIDDADNFVE